MDRFSRPNHERGARSAEDSFAAHRVKLYKELRRLAEMDVPARRLARAERASATVEDDGRLPLDSSGAFLEKAGPSGVSPGPKVLVLGHSSERA